VKTKPIVTFLLAVMAVGSFGSALAGTEAAPTRKMADDPGRELAIRALNNMASYLRSLDRYHVMGHVSRETVLDDGQKLQLDKEVSLLVAEPDRMFMEATSAYGKKEFYYDGKQFTVYLPGFKYYASFDAPDNLLETIIQAEEKYDVEFPFVDLFLWGTEYGGFDLIDEAMVVGVGMVDGISCNRFAFRQKEVDWQICIKRGGDPLPLKLVITTKTEEELPQYVVTMKWDTAPVVASRTFSFKPRKDDQKIRFGTGKLQPGKPSSGGGK